ncbi:MAG: helicase-associated domain-containing protein [Ktedonobacteraceae bacterium]|nr:helicase-associated domain-containing protein [Ktedonobacteraceae bacterium]
MQAPLDTAPAAIEQAETTVIYDIATLINAVYQIMIEPTKDGRVPKRIAKKLYPLIKGMERTSYLSENDEYLDMLFAILQGMQLVKETRPPVDGVKSRFQAGDKLAAWAELDLVGQTGVLLEHWQRELNWDDVGELEMPEEMPGERNDFDFGSRFGFDMWNLAFSTDNLAARTTLISHLRTCLSGRWYSVDTLLRDIWQLNPLGSRRSMSAQMRKSEEKKARESYSRWYKTNALNYVSMLNSSLHELGIVDLGYKKSPNDEDDIENHSPEAFQITSLGVKILHGTKRSPASEAEEVANSRSLIVQPSFELLLLQPDLPTLYSILPFAQANQIGTASRLTLTQNSLHRGMATGKTVAQIIHILERHTQKELPQNVLYTLQDWAKLYKETRLSMVMLIETPSEQVAKQIAAQDRFQRWHIREIAPCILTLDGDANLQEVRNALEKTGVTIQFTGAFPKPTRSSNDRYSYE